MNPTDILAAIQACWCTLLQGSLGGAPAQCCTVVGPPAIVQCCDGFAWVRLIGAYPTGPNFPAHLTVSQNCPAYTWALQIEVGITRCAPEPCDVLDNTCCSAQASAAAIQLNDFALMQQIFCSCDTGIASRDIVIGSYTPYGPEGGCIGGKLTVTINALSVD